MIELFALSTVVGESFPCARAGELSLRIATGHEHVFQAQATGSLLEQCRERHVRQQVGAETVDDSKWRVRIAPGIEGWRVFAQACGRCADQLSVPPEQL